MNKNVSRYFVSESWVRAAGFLTDKIRKNVCGKMRRHCIQICQAVLQKEGFACLVALIQLLGSKAKPEQTKLKEAVKESLAKLRNK